MKENFKKALKYVKTIFFIGIIVLIVFELSKLRKEISISELKNIMESIGIFKMAVIGIFSLLAITPMINYDFLFNDMMGDVRDRKYIIERSITINTFNNLIGFGGIINIGLRAEYFGDDKEKGPLMKMIVKSFLFYFTGCSFLSLVSLIHALLTKDAIILNYFVVLIGGLLYYFVALIASKIKNSDGPKFSLAFALKFSLTSVLEWSLAFCSFYLIGHLLGVEINFFRLLGVYVISILMGIVSMIPGGLGSFDLVALSILSSTGISRELILSWLLLYRLFYYIIPFFIGLIFFIKNSSNFFDKKKDDKGSNLIKSMSCDLLAGMLFLLAFFLILSVTIPDELEEIKWLSKFGHLRGNIIYQFPSVVLGFLYIYLGIAIDNRVKRAFYPTEIFLFLGLIYASVTDFSIYTISYIIFCMILAIISRDELYRKQLVYSYESVTKISIFIIFLTLISILEFTRNYRFIRIKSINDFILLPFEIPLVKSLIFIGILFVFVYILNIYLEGNKEKIGQDPDFSTIDYLLKTYQSNTTAGLSYLGDKEMFYIRDEEKRVNAALQFATYKDKVVVMGEPFGDPASYGRLIENFIKKADLYGYSPVFYEISEDYILKLHDFGFEFMKFGENASVNLEDFSLTGSSKKSLRNALNKVQKSGFTFEILEPPFSGELMEKLKIISDKWLDGRKEKGFSLGFFDETYLKKSQIAVVKSDEGEIVAFANIMPNKNSDEVSVDLMRFDEDKAPSGTMDFLFINIFLHFKDAGKKSFDLGMAPLYNVGVNENSFLQEKLAFLIYKFGDRFYSFEGLRNYKEKFVTEWQPRYTSYSKKTWLVYLVLILVKLETTDVNRKKNN